jgi:hypothetical protein
MISTLVFLIVLAIVAIVVYVSLDHITPFAEEIYKHYKVAYCVHEYDREVDEHGYQYCKICNAARHVGSPLCVHDWKIDEKFRIKDSETGSVVRTVTVLKCTKCGDMKNHEISSQ